MQLGPCSSGLLSLSECAVKKIQNELRSVDIPHCHSLNPCGYQTLEEDRWQPFNELLSRSLSCSSDESQFFSSSTSITQLGRRQSVRGCRSTSFRLGSCRFRRAREWAAWPAMSALKALICTRSNVVLWSGSFHSSPNETAKLLYNTILAHFQARSFFDIRVPSRSPATKKRTESCSLTPFFWNCLFELHNKFFSAWNIRSPQKAPKRLILQLRLQNKPIQSYLSIQVYSDTKVVVTSSIFQLRRETTPEHKLADLPKGCITASVEWLLHAVGGKCTDFRPRTQ